MQSLVSLALHRPATAVFISSTEPYIVAPVVIVNFSFEIVDWCIRWPGTDMGPCHYDTFIIVSELL